ncbi:MAG: DUF4358 domain-containing protein [Clostridiales bacterium]|nr:DUF4358 domain-containing protein [Clostridiales bacterium]
MRRISILMLCLLLCGGCGAGSPVAAVDGGGRQDTAFTMDVGAFGDRLYRELEFRDQLEELEPSVVYALLGVDGGDVAAQKNYFSSGATAEEIILFQGVDAEAAGKLMKALEARLDYQKEVYASYAPEEVNYLKRAILLDKGAYVVFCVAADADAARAVIEEALKD